MKLQINKYKKIVYKNNVDETKNVKVTKLEASKSPSYQTSPYTSLPRNDNITPRPKSKLLKQFERKTIY